MNNWHHTGSMGQVQMSSPFASQQNHGGFMIDHSSCCQPTFSGPFLAPGEISHPWNQFNQLSHHYNPGFHTPTSNMAYSTNNNTYPYNHHQIWPDQSQSGSGDTGEMEQVQHVLSLSSNDAQASVVYSDYPFSYNFTHPNTFSG